MTLEEGSERHSRSAFAFAVVVAIGGCSSGGAGSADDIVVRGGGLFDGRGDAVVPNPGIVIEGDRFLAIDADVAEEAVEAGATVVDVREGEVVLPGLFDLHAHYHLTIVGEGRVDETKAYPAMFLANGVINTFPNGEATPNAMRTLQERLQSGEQVGARLHRSGPYFGSARVGWDPELTTEDIHRQVDAAVLWVDCAPGSANTHPMVANDATTATGAVAYQVRSGTDHLSDLGP